MQSFHLKSHTILREYACRDIDEAHDVTDLFRELNRNVDEDIVNADVKDINGHVTNAVVIETLDPLYDTVIERILDKYMAERLSDEEYRILGALGFGWKELYWGTRLCLTPKTPAEIKKLLDNLVSKGYAEKDDCREFYRRLK